MTRKRLGLLLAAAVFATSGAQADDRWEAPGQPGGDDDDSTTTNLLTSGDRQTHDVQGSPGAGSNPSDLDWMTVQTKVGHSYEARVFNAPLRFSGGGCGVCGAADRVTVAGTVLTPGVSLEGAGPVNGLWAHSQVIRWIGSATQRDWIRVAGERFFDQTANDQYEVELLDTTYFIPRWNQAGSQFTVLLIQNTSAALVTGSILFYDAAGTLLHTEPLSVARNGVQVVQGGSIPALANQSGSAAIVHTGGYGALAGKAVALEPGTGFTFDTLIAPLPR